MLQSYESRGPQCNFWTNKALQKTDFASHEIIYLNETNIFHLEFFLSNNNFNTIKNNVVKHCCSNRWPISIIQPAKSADVSLPCSRDTCIINFSSKHKYLNGHSAQLSYNISKQTRECFDCFISFIIEKIW